MSPLIASLGEAAEHDGNGPATGTSAILQPAIGLPNAYRPRLVHGPLEAHEHDLQLLNHVGRVLPRGPPRTAQNRPPSASPNPRDLDDLPSQGTKRLARRT